MRAPWRMVRGAGVTTLGAVLVTLAASPLAALPAAASTGVSAVQVQALCSAAKPGFRACLALRVTSGVTASTPAAGTPNGLSPNGLSPTALPAGYGPSDLSSAYNLPASGGAGTTVAIVDAYDQPTAESDLAAYRSTYGLPACTTANGCFKKVNQNGATSPLPAANSGWGGEIDLDIQMVSAACPGCNILLVEANTASNTNLDTAVNTAAASGAKVVSNSYGGPETPTDPNDGSYNHAGVLITVSSGDGGYGVEFPAASPTVLAVGGTSLTRNAGTSRGWSESVWSTSASEGAGSGCSAYETKPTWQHDTGCQQRTVADVSAIADPNTGVAVYDGGWQIYGGTSVASPLVAAIFALTGQTSATPQFPYANSTDFYDVTAGKSANCGSYLCAAQAGYDGPTGIGTPNGRSMAGGAAAAQDFSISGSVTAASAAPGTAATFTVTTATTVGAVQTVSLSASGLPPGASASFAPVSLTSGNSSTMTITTSTTTPPGSYPITVTGTGVSGSHSTSVTLTVTGATSCASTSQLLANPGFESGNTVWATSSPTVINGTTSGSAPHSGSWKAWIDGYGTSHTDTLSQSVTIPANACSATFTFWLKVTTAETTTVTPYDKLTVTAGSTKLKTYSNLNHSTGYSKKSFNLIAFKGQTVQLTFTGVENATLQTSFFIDDTAVTVVQ